MSLIKAIPIIYNSGITLDFNKNKARIRYLKYNFSQTKSSTKKKYNRTFSATRDVYGKDIKVLEPTHRIEKSKINNRSIHFEYICYHNPKKYITSLSAKVCIFQSEHLMSRLIFPRLIRLYLECILPAEVILPPNLLFLKIRDKSPSKLGNVLMGLAELPQEELHYQNPIILPPNLIEANCRYNRITIIGDKLKILKFSKRNQQPILIPENSQLEYLKCGHQYNCSIELPNSLKMLYLGYYYNQPLNLPPNLEYFYFESNEYNNLQLKLPNSLRYLSMRRHWKHETDGPLPTNLEYFSPGRKSSFDIPNKMRILQFAYYSKYKNEFNFSSTLTHLALPGNSTKRNINLPESLLFLKVYSFWDWIPNLPKNLKALILGPDRRGFTTHKIIRKTKLIFFGLKNYTIELPESVEYLTLGEVCSGLGDDDYCSIVKKNYKQNNNKIDNYCIELNNNDRCSSSSNNKRYVDDKECIYLFWIRKRRFTEKEEEYHLKNDVDNDVDVDVDNDVDNDNNNDDETNVDPKVNLNKDVLYSMMNWSHHPVYWGPSNFEMSYST